MTVTHSRPPTLVLLLVAAGCTQDPAADMAGDVVADTHVAPVPQPRLSFVDASDRIGSPVIRAYGTSLVDYDDDGWPDVTIAHADGLILLHAPPGGAGSFVADNERAGIPADLLDSHAVVWADVDGDDDLDLFVGRRSLMSQNRDKVAVGCRLFRNIGGAVFEDVSEAAGVSRPGYWEGVAFGDLDGDEDLDLVVVGGIRPAEGDRRTRGKNGSADAVYFNDGSGHFTDVSATIGCTGSLDSEGWGTLLADLDMDGDLDILIGNDSAASTFCRNVGGGHFQDDPAFSLDPKAFGLMGFSVGDLFGDGCPDVYGTNFGPAGMFTLNDKGEFPNAYSTLLAGAHDRAETVSGWGATLEDLDHDGDQDLLWVAAQDTAREASQSVLLPGALAVLSGVPSADGVTLVDLSDAAGPRFLDVHNGYGLATGDIDQDGDVDVLVGVDALVGTDGAKDPSLRDLHRTTMLLRNDSPASDTRALAVTLRQPGPNRRAVGATVTVRAAGHTTLHVVTAGDSYLSSHDYPLHFGLGTAAAADWVRVRWPRGTTQVFRDVPAGRVEFVRSDASCVPEGACADVPEPSCRPFEQPNVIASGCDPGGAVRCDAACARIEECDWFSYFGGLDPQQCVSGCQLCPPSSANIDAMLKSPCDQPPPLPNTPR